jgi:L-threonylcarbamoyladenylate synthase
MITSGIIRKAVELLRSGGLVAFPTETVYGLGADALSDRAVAEIFAVKNRPQFNPLIVHVDGIAMAQRHAVWNGLAEKLAHDFWPGPLTLVLPRTTESAVSLLCSAGGDTLALRMPANADARALITAAGVPLAAPSANRSGRVSPTTAQHVKDEFGNDVPLILDGGPCLVGIESTVVDITGGVPLLLRSGFVTREQLEEALGRKVMKDTGVSGILKSPGLLRKHYAPSLPVRLNVTTPRPDEALLAFGPKVPRGARGIINLSESGDLKEAAARLFADLRALDKPEYTAIAVMAIPQEGLGVAINDRLMRAAYV